MIRITSKRDGFRRAGIAHSKEPKEYPEGTFTAEQIEQLKAEQMLVVEMVEDAGDQPPPQKQLNVGETVKLVMACKSTDELEQFAADERKGVIDAVQKRGQELAEEASGSAANEQPAAAEGGE